MAMSSGRLAVVCAAAWLSCAGAVGSRAAAAGRIYRLDAESTFQHGCFDPCTCPIGDELNVRGTFSVQFGGVGDVMNFYHVRDVNWLVATPDGDIRITGGGTYAVSNAGPDMQWLELDLVVGDLPVQHFFSDAVPTGDGLSHIDLTISVNGIYCLDTVIHVVATPVSPAEILRLTFSDKSTFQEGCWDPCDCPLSELMPVSGGFGLVVLSQNAVFAEYAVVDVHWLARGSNNALLFVPVTGVGTYTVGGEVASVHRLSVDLVVAGDAPTHFDSGLVAGGGAFPTIDILISINGMVCWDRVFDLLAVPSE
ncbi:MAG: hypothetical protein ACE5E6_05715 [Phycisphaerae bacterium]